MTSLKLFKLKLQSYVKRMKKVNFYRKISLFGHTDNYFNSHFHNLRSYCNAIRVSMFNYLEEYQYEFYV